MEAGRAVLIVEDDPPTQTLLSAVARHCGFEPVVVADGAAALARLARKKFDVMLLDLLLPGMNGFELLRHLKCTNPRVLRRTIVVTAAAETTTRYCVELERVWKFLRKPLDLEDLALQMIACAVLQEEKNRTSSPGQRPLVRGNDAAAR